MLTFWDPYAIPFAIDWAAWATLVTGLLAVGGALAVGLKQARISDRQARILERQTEISATIAETESARLRYELYDMRSKVYSGIEQYVVDASNYSQAVSHEVREELYRSISVARFVLGDDVEALAREILKTGIGLRSSAQRLDRLDGDDPNHERLFNEVNTLSDRMNALHSDLRATMENYLSLTRPPAVPG